jgi:hypothetical protein
MAKNLCAVMAFDGLAIGRQHGADHTQFRDGAPKLGAGSLAVLDRNQRHAFDPRRDFSEFFIKPVVVRAASGDCPILGDDAADCEAGGGIYHRPIDSGLVEKIDPLLRTHVARPRTLLAAFEKMKMNMIERWKNLCAVTGRHEFRNLVHTRPVVDMAVGIDDLHVRFPFAAICLPITTRLPRFNDEGLQRSWLGSDLAQKIRS